MQYIRQKKKPVNITIEYPNFADRNSIKDVRPLHQKPSQAKVVESVEKYIKMLKEVSLLDNYATKKIYKNILHFLEEFPTMSFLYEVTSAFGKVQKKLSMNESLIIAEATDEMIPLFEKINEKI